MELDLVIAAETWKPWFLITEERDNTTTYSGIMWEVRPPDKKWGAKAANGSWNGMVGMLHRREVDMALGPFGITEAREEVCDFSYPLVVDSWTILMAAPAITADPWVMARPFDGVTWITLVFALSAILTVVLFTNAIYGDKGNFYKICGFVFRVLFCQPASWMPSQKNYQRVLTATWAMSLFILAQGYSGTLVSMFTAPSFHIPINSLNDLVEQSQLPWAIEDGSMLVDIGKASPEGSSLRKLHDGSLPFTGLCDSNVEKIKAGEFAETCVLLEVFAILSEDFKKAAKCNLFFAQNGFFPVNIAMAVQNGSPLLDRLNHEVMSLVEAGLPDQWLNAFLPNMTKCDSVSAIKEAKIAEHAGGMSLDLVEVKGIFVLVGVCLSVAMTVFIIELSILWFAK